MKRFIKYMFGIIIVLFLAVYIINSETDFFRSFDQNYPEITERAPIVSKTCQSISDTFSKLPSVQKIKEYFVKVKMPVEPDTFAENAYIKDSPLLCFYEKEAVGITINEDNTFTVFGILLDTKKPNLIVRVKDSKNNKITESSFSLDSEFKFSKTMRIPATNENLLVVDVFAGENKYGNYIGLVNDYIYLTNNEGTWEIKKSPVYKQNKDIYASPKSTSKALKSTKHIEADNKKITALAEKVTRGCTTDYEKALAIHDWICSNVHYDNDSLSKSIIAPHSATDVLKSKKAVCIGYANLFAAMARSCGIPSYVVTGYALGISSGSRVWTDKIISGKEENHAWNEAYIDGRWVIIDSTWDTYNSFEDGAMQTNSDVSHLYFDANIDFFSQNHKIMNYQ